MRTSKPHSYEIYAASRALNAPVTIIVDKFSVFAFLFHGLWLIYHGAWRVGVIWFVAFGSVAAVGDALALHTNVIAMMQLFMQLWLGFEAATLLALDARMRGLHLQEVVVASSEDDAEIAYYRHHLPSAV